ncbi:MAG TPA: AmmeMemoRadiSam system protein B [Clostridiales bacterium]|nr:AmmeMemoRadiSam system protein B [Clostridiales bacterium]
MQLNKINIAVIFITTLLILFSIFIAVLNEKENSLDFYLPNSEQSLQCLYYNVLDFMSIKEYNNLEEVGTIRGLIVPHHLLAKDLIHEAFQISDRTKYKTIVVFGPDHESMDRGKVFTSSSNWQTPTGILNANKDIIEIISNLDFVVENNEKLTIEHSISGLVPFIEYYYYDVKIIPIALTKQLTLENLDKLLISLVENIEVEDTLFISSVDFSHYLSLEKANEMDKISIEAISNKDIKKIKTFTNDNLDSPNSITAMLKAMDLIGAKNMKILNNSNSQIILNKKLDETTSYITFMFY